MFSICRNTLSEAYPLDVANIKLLYIIYNLIESTVRIRNKKQRKSDYMPVK